MNWRIKASLQKILAASKLGDQLNHLPVTFNKEYHKNIFLYQTHECLRKFSYCNLNLRVKSTALEIGTGYSILSSIVLALLGFEKIITVDITKDLKFSTYKKQIAFIESPSFLNEIVSKSVYDENQIKSMISSIKEKKSFSALFEFLNIAYLAPYTFEEIEKHAQSFDYISSQVVLEHISPDVLNELFQKTKSWLTKDGFCVHTVNFIDHFANPGFFQDKSISEFNFLKYSDKYWSFWASNSIAYTNRLSYIYYMQLSEKYDLKVISFIGENYRKRIELDLNFIHKDVINKYISNPETEDLTKFQRGTFIIKA
ncbi:hypothetical protein DMB65_02815 [Flavobacterium cheongpyeongense]|uniref:Class I SAM-dependent methyltransferase n=1 Tax=Flavobacterium cheongpyeongense TaxID=2212651 RepID=A0A2V4BWD5_9FLAO|nr:methyltransferase domain-containing protein [Flavobacterium cheongpyeongense]PXY42183.1 hypothetical protein DMB65_02815 [Flavobacterium cheongpyeongense]